MSVIVPNWNGSAQLEECLDSLARQTYANREVVVVDNASTDRSLELCREHEEQPLVLRNSVNRGFAGGVNAGIRMAKGDCVALLNNDAVAAPRWLEELVRATEHAEIAAAKILLHHDPTLVDSTGDFYSRWGLPYPRQRGQKDDVAYSGYPEIFAASGGACIFKKAVFDDIGLFDEAFFAYFEDVDISMRARLAGYKVVLAPRAVVYHHMSATSSKLGDFNRYHTIKNTALLFGKNMPTSLLLKYAPRVVCVETVLIARAVVNGAWRAAARALVDLVRHLPGLLQDRRATQRRRTLTPQELDRMLTDHWSLKTFVLERARAPFTSSQHRREQ